MGVAEACSYAERGSWLAPDAGAPGGGTVWPRNTDAKKHLVGRWAACQTGTLVQAPNEGIEFGANGRWQLLENERPAPNAPRGTYSFLDIGQLNTSADGAVGSSITSGVRFSIDGQALRTATSGIYVRIPTPANYGRDNLPSTTDGACTLVGTWDTQTIDRGAKPLVISFDEVGNFAAGDPGANLCQAQPMYGPYELSPGRFELTQNVGMGLCDFWYSAGFRVMFDGSCSRLTLATVTDGCTGGRGYLNGVTSLVKRP
jgi:hypothetical protein